jgi:hypothetical protein
VLNDAKIVGEVPLVVSEIINKYLGESIFVESSKKAPFLLVGAKRRAFNKWWPFQEMMISFTSRKGPSL